jgi:DNA repair exonuclease SbcCD ATPase subunit
LLRVFLEKFKRNYIVERNFMGQILCAFLLGFLSVSIQAQQASPRKDRSGLITTEQIIKQTQPEVIPLPDESFSDKSDADKSQVKGQQKGRLNESGQANGFEISELRKKIEKITSRLDLLESSRRSELTEKERRLLLNLEILSRAEERVESLRQKLFDLSEKESAIRSRLNQIELESTDEAVNRSIALIGGLRPEVLREQRRKSLESEKNNLLNLLTQIENHKLRLQENITKADALVEKLRSKLEAQIEEAFQEENF